MRVRAELDGPSTFWFYANARNELGQRIWLQGEDSLSSTAADIGGPLDSGPSAQIAFPVAGQEQPSRVWSMAARSATSIERSYVLSTYENRVTYRQP